MAPAEPQATLAAAIMEDRGDAHDFAGMDEMDATYDQLGDLESHWDDDDYDIFGDDSGLHGDTLAAAR